MAEYAGLKSRERALSQLIEDDISLCVAGLGRGRGEVFAAYGERKSRELLTVQQRIRAVLPLLAFDDYLATEEWVATRAAVLDRSGCRCQMCGVTGLPLEIHHNSYANRGFEDPRDLVSLDRDCHRDAGRRMTDRRRQHMCMACERNALAEASV